MLMCEEDQDQTERSQLRDQKLNQQLLSQTLMPHQASAVRLLDNGKILYGGVGVGKSLTALAYYLLNESARDVYVITTAKKRDSYEWEAEAVNLGIGPEGLSLAGVLTVDSWNNIAHYTEEEGSFFIFDEQRVVGHGAWVKSFIKIAKKNRWIILSATPGDVWLDYAPVFIANGWYKNITDFKRQHVVYDPFVRFPRVQQYIGTQKLERLRNEVLVEMPYPSHTERHLNYLEVGHDVDLIQKLIRERWHPFENRPIKDAAELWRLMRYVINTDPSRLETIRFLMAIHPKLIIFYNFDYELDLLRGLAKEIALGEYNGHRKQPIPDVHNWVYLVQYVAGAEGWNCVETDAMVLYSLTYSYKNFVQSQGRIDRLNTPYRDLYYYILVSRARVDKAVQKALSNKKNFNEWTERRKLDKNSANR